MSRRMVGGVVEEGLIEEIAGSQPREVDGGLDACGRMRMRSLMAWVSGEAPLARVAAWRLARVRARIWSMTASA